MKSLRNHSMTPRKPLTPEEAAIAKEKRKEYQREYKRQQRANPDFVEPEKKETRTYSDRAEYQREYQKEYRKKKAKQDKPSS